MILEKSKLKLALDSAAVLVRNNSVNNKVLFKASGNNVSLTCGDGVNIGSFSFENNDEGDVSFVTEYDNLGAALSLRGDIELSYANGAFQMKEGYSSLRFPAQDADTFLLDSSFVDESSSRSISLPARSLKSLLEKISYVRKESAQKEMKFMEGILVVQGGGRLTATASNGAMLMVNSVESQGNEDGFKFLLTGKAIDSLMLVPDEEEVTLTEDGNALRLKTGSADIYLAGLNVGFPDVSRFFEDKFGSEFTVSKSKALESLEILSASSNTTLDIGGDGELLSLSKEDGISDILDKIQLEEMTGGSFEFSVDYGRFRSLFQNMKEGETLSFGYVKGSKKVFFNDEGDMKGILMMLTK